MNQKSSENPSPPASEKAEGIAAAPGAKLPYSSPTLREFGSVSRLTMTGSGTGADGGTTAGMQMASDRCIKENIVRAGEHPLGIGAQEFTSRHHPIDARPKHAATQVDAGNFTGSSRGTST